MQFLMENPRGRVYDHLHSEDDGAITYEGLVTHPRGSKHIGSLAQMRVLALSFHCSHLQF